MVENQEDYKKLYEELQKKHEELLKSLDEIKQKEATFLGLRKPLTFNVKCSGKTRTMQVKPDDTFQVIGQTIKNSLDLSTVPNLYVDGKQITEESLSGTTLYDVIGNKQVVCEIFNPWNIAGADDSGIDYNRLIELFGVKPIEQDHIKRLEAITGKPAHPWLRRGFFFSHRDFDKILETLERGDTIYLYTGRGPSSSSLHLGHIIQFMFAKYLQEAIGCVLVIQMSNDEKFIFKKQLSLTEIEKMTFENVKDILALGYDVDRTFIFSDLDYIGSMYRPILTLLKHTSSHSESKIYGFDGSSPAGYYTWPCIQAAPAFSCAFPHLFGPPFIDTLTNTKVGPSTPINKSYVLAIEERKRVEKEREKEKKEKEKKGKEGGGKKDKNRISPTPTATTAPVVASSVVDSSTPSSESSPSSSSPAPTSGSSPSPSSSSSSSSSLSLSSFSPYTVPCLIPCAIDQDPYFRMARDIAPYLELPPPSTILSRFLPDLGGASSKMSASTAAPHDTASSSESSESSSSPSESSSSSNSSSSSSSSAAAASASFTSAIFMDSSEKHIRQSINSAFTIGADTLQQQLNGGSKLKDINQDIPFVYLSIFDLETGDEEINELRDKYVNGYGEGYYERMIAEAEQKQKEEEEKEQKEATDSSSSDNKPKKKKVKLDASKFITSGYLKNRLINVLIDLTKKHQKNRSEVTDEQVKMFMRQRLLKIGKS